MNKETVDEIVGRALRGESYVPAGDEDVLVSAQPAAPPGVAYAELPDERAAFEAWIRKDCGDLSTFGSGQNIHYSNSAVNNAWTGWKARASNGQAPAGATVRHLEVVIKDAADKLEAAMRCHPNAVETLTREALEILHGDPEPFTTAQAAESAPAIQGETNVQLDIDSNTAAPGQQRGMACSLALGQPVGNGQDQVAGHLGAQGDKLLTVAERNIRSFLRSAVFKSESDREAALSCVDVLRDAARAPAESVLEDAERYRWLRRWKGQEHEPPFTVQHEIDGTLWGGDLDAAIDTARKQGANHD